MDSVNLDIVVVFSPIHLDCSQYAAQLHDTVRHSLPHSSTGMHRLVCSNTKCTLRRLRATWGGGVISSEATPLGVIRSRLLPLLWIAVKKRISSLRCRLFYIWEGKKVLTLERSTWIRHIFERRQDHTSEQVMTNTRVLLQESWQPVNKLRLPSSCHCQGQIHVLLRLVRILLLLLLVLLLIQSQCRARLLHNFHLGTVKSLSTIITSCVLFCQNIFFLCISCLNFDFRHFFLYILSFRLNMSIVIGKLQVLFREL